MKDLVWSIVLVLLSTSLVMGFGQSQQGYEAALQEQNWTTSNDFGFPVWLALNSPSGAGRANLRKIFVFIEANNFTKDNVQTVFTGLATRYPDPVDLIMTAFSDRAMLIRAIGVSESGVAIEFSKAPEKQEAVQKFKDEFYPLKSGYYRAYYSRSRRGSESFQYSPDPDKEALVRVQLKPQL
jgi:hypothetical protein